MTTVNTAQAEQWNTGDGVAHWVDNQARYDRMHAPFTAMIIDAAGLRPGTDVLDVGCGCGGTTRAAAQLIAPGQAVGLDLSGPMLARARASAEAEGSRASLIVEDSGPGIPQADRSRLFDRFHRATEPGSGTGIGLAIGDSIVRSTGGHWRVGDSGLGGALMAVSWRHTQPRAFERPS